MDKVLFIFSGEGTSHSDSSFKLARTSPVWTEAASVLREELGIDLEETWDREVGRHRCPLSPILTVVCGICLSDIWKRWGYRPDVVVGHSVGELAAAYETGFYGLRELLLLTHRIGTVAANLSGGMLHGTLSDEEIDALEVTLSSRNFRDGDHTHVTVSGSEEEMAAFLAEHAGFREMRPRHPWHHPDYEGFAGKLSAYAAADGGREDRPLFVSGVTGRTETSLPADHWKRWVTGRIDFVSAMQAVADRFEEASWQTVEIGFHPVLESCCDELETCTYVSSMYRGEDELEWILFQRRRLDRRPFIEAVSGALEAFRPGIDPDAPLSYQGFTSRTFVEVTEVLEPFFPGLAPQDFYRFKSVGSLIDKFGAVPQGSVAREDTDARSRNAVVVAGMSCRFPAEAENPAQFWNMLMSGEDQVRPDPERGDYEAGFLDPRVSRFDHRFFGISEAEAKTMDPQQILALELTEMLFRDAGIDPSTLDRRRFGVYLGVWNEEYAGDRTSAYYPTGTNPSMVASRISYHYDLRGPSWVSNTACSSSLVAVHYACKDIEDGRVDYAIAGGVNMLLGNRFTANMRDSGFLSKDQRCKAFDDSANGYVRAEGGGLVLLAREGLVDRHYGFVLGSSVNQNGGRPQVITAPHPEAQEEVILDACRDAGVAPRDIGYVECHGTGTKIGDPIEVSAIQNTIARDRDALCYLGAVKSNMGHLESAAGMAGLIKAVLALNLGSVPPDLHFATPNQYIDFDSHHLRVVTETTPIDAEAKAGVSSFGFGGTNAHLVITGAAEAVRKEIVDLPSPFDRERAAPLSAYFSLNGSSTDSEAPQEEPLAAAASGASVRETAERAFIAVTNVTEIDPDIELTDQGLDSMGATQFLTMLQEGLGVKLDTDLLFDYPLIDQLVGFLDEACGASDGGNGGASGSRSREAVEQAVRRIFREVTAIEEIDTELDITDQGLDSMGATELVTRLQSELGVPVDPDILFECPLFDQLVDRLHAAQGAPSA